MLRFDESVKLKMEAVTFYQNNRKIKIILEEICKNTTYTREYTLEPWGGRLGGSLKMDACFHFMKWVLVRGDSPGFLFCHVDQNGRIMPGRQMESQVFLNWFQGCLQDGGESPVGVRAFRGHSMKRGGVKIWKSLGRADGWIMRRMHASGFAAFLRYAFNNRGSWPDQVPEFSNISATQEFFDGIGISMLQFYLNEDEFLDS